MRRNARKDANQDEIVKFARSIGAKVAITHQLGGGFPDIVVGYHEFNYMIEIKDGSQPPSKRKLTDDEEQFHSEWKGQIDIVKNTDELQCLLGLLGWSRSEFINKLKDIGWLEINDYGNGHNKLWLNAVTSKQFDFRHWLEYASQKILPEGN